MAGRSDRTSVLPRRWKRHLALTSTNDPHRDGEIRRLVIAAHKHGAEVRDKMSKSNFIGGESPDEPANQNSALPNTSV